MDQVSDEMIQLNTETRLRVWSAVVTLANVIDPQISDHGVFREFGRIIDDSVFAIFDWLTAVVTDGYRTEAMLTVDFTELNSERHGVEGGGVR